MLIKEVYAVKVWQIATGELGRDYRELFFAHDIMILGPSHTGRVTGDATKYSYAGGTPNSAYSQVHSFAYNPSSGDRVIMRFGKTVIGVGQIPQDGKYFYDETFKHVYGWDLAHCRRVIWASSSCDLGVLGNVFSGASKIPSFTQVLREEVVKEVQNIDNSHFARSPKDMPKIDTSEYKETDLGVELFRAGISNKNIEDILKALQQASRLCSWYRSGHSGRKPSESEIISHSILPLFLGLGWSHQQIAVEWNRVDMAFFKNTPTMSENCVMVLEAKELGRALSEVLRQPIAYVEDLKLKNVKYILTTDGENLFVYGKNGDKWESNSNPIGYISVSSLQKNYILPKGTNLVDTLVMLQPSSM
ncbi:MAG: hypothetical protein HC875_19245 [Anaerolineales bacterium]|nr:hypothetical protein [Anaerolineales bacterium]